MGKANAAAEKRVQARVSQPVTAPGPAPAAAAAPASPMRNVVLVGGLSAAAIGSALAYVTRTFASLDTLLPVLYTVVAIFVLLLVPVAIYALVRLHARNLSSLLEASGWAINARMRLTRPVARIICVDPHRPAADFGESSVDVTREWSEQSQATRTQKPSPEE